MLETRSVTIWVTLSSTLAISTLMLADDAPHPDVAIAQQQFQLELQKALGPVFKRQGLRLDSLQKVLTRKGDLDGALQIKDAIKQFKMLQSRTLKSNSVAGRWVVKYDNGYTRYYNILEDGTVSAVDQGRKKTGRVTKKGDHFLLDFGDGHLERLTLRKTLLSDFYSDAKEYPSGKPEIRGIGEQSKKAE